MMLELTTAEREFLVEVLNARLGDLRQEVRHSRVSSFTEELKRTEEILKGLIGKIKSEQPTGSQS